MKTNYLFSLLLIIPTLAFGSGDDELLKLLQPIKTIQANFKQSPIHSRSRLVKTTYGKMTIARPNRFLWDIQKPQHQVIIADGKRLWYYDKDLKQVTVQPLAQAMGDTPAGLLSNISKATLQKFNISYKQLRNRNGDQIFTLQPKSKDASFQTVSLTFKKKKLDLMFLENNLGQKSTIKFDNLKINQAVNNALFTFKPPKGTDIIEK